MTKAHWNEILLVTLWIFYILKHDSWDCYYGLFINRTPTPASSGKTIIASTFCQHDDLILRDDTVKNVANNILNENCPFTSNVLFLRSIWIFWEYRLLFCSHIITQQYTIWGNRPLRHYTEVLSVLNTSRSSPLWESWGQLFSHLFFLLITLHDSQINKITSKTWYLKCCIVFHGCVHAV